MTIREYPKKFNIIPVCDRDPITVQLEKFYIKPGIPPFEFITVSLYDDERFEQSSINIQEKIDQIYKAKKKKIDDF